MSLTITLPDNLARLVEEKVACGHYGGPLEVVGAALLALETDLDIDPVELKRLWDEGLASGVAGPFDADDIRQEARRLRAAHK